MKAKTYKKEAGLAVVFVLALAVFFPMLEGLVDRPEKRDPTSETQVMEKDLYQNDGLGEGLQLSDEVLYSDDDVVIYPDRLLRRFSYKKENAENIAAIVRAVKSACVQDLDFYILPVPLRINVSEGYDDEEKLYSDCFLEIQDALSGEAALVDVRPELEAHIGEYIFFRTEDTWTARGACYGSGALCEALGKTPYALEDYEEYMYNSFFGNLRVEYKDAENLPTAVLDEIGQICNDQVYYYGLPDDKNRKAVLKDGKWVKMPMFTPSVRGMGTFTGGGGYQAAIIEGEGNGTVLLICDDDGALLAPYMAGYYAQVYVINIKEYNDLAQNLDDIVSEYGIKSVIWAQSAPEMGDHGYTRALNDFLE